MGFSGRCPLLSNCGSQAPRAQAQLLCYTGLVATQHVESSQTGDQTSVPCIAWWILNHRTMGEVPRSVSSYWVLYWYQMVHVWECLLLASWLCFSEVALLFSQRRWEAQVVQKILQRYRRRNLLVEWMWGMRETVESWMIPRFGRMYCQMEKARRKSSFWTC